MDNCRRSTVDSTANETWYSYIARGPENTITVISSGVNPIKKAYVAIKSTDCTVNSSDTCLVAAGTPDTVSLSQNIPVGTRVWIQVAGFQEDGEFELCIRSSQPPPASGDSCQDARIIYNKDAFDLTNLTNLDSGQFKPSCFKQHPDRDIWFMLTVDEPGLFEWTVTPHLETDPSGVELDWAVYDITNGCPSDNEVEMACNYNYSGPSNHLPVGMKSGSNTQCPISIGTSDSLNEFCPPVNVETGHTYAILIDFFNIRVDSVDLSAEWSGTFGINGDADAKFSFDLDTCEKTATFHDSSKAALLWHWDFGEKAIPQTADSAGLYEVVWTESGKFSVSLTVTSSTGDISTYYDTITIENIDTVGIPKFYAEADTCLDRVTFHDSSTAATFAWHWNFGENATPATADSAGPYTIDYSKPGNYFVSIKLTSKYGCELTYTDSVAVFGSLNIPNANFGMELIDCSNSILITDSSKLALQWQWDFDSVATPRTFNMSNPDTVVYSDTGFYSINLKVVSALGCEDVYVDTIYIPELVVPKAVFSSISDSCSNLVTFYDSSFAVSKWQWSFGDSALTMADSTGPYKIDYQFPGEYDVKLKVISTLGCIDSISGKVVIHGDKYIPRAKFSSELISCSNKIVFNDSSILADQWNWEFGSAASAQMVSGKGPHIISYSNTGNFTIKLAVRSAQGCLNIIEKSIHVPELVQPVSKFYSDFDQFGNDVTLYDSSIAATDWLWNFGLNAIPSKSTSSGPHKINYKQAGEYVVSLTVTSSIGCSNQSFDTIRVFGDQFYPHANFSSELIDCGYQMYFYDSSISAVNWFWEFDSLASAQSISGRGPHLITYSDTGDYVVRLTVQSKQRCEHSHADTVYVAGLHLDSCKAIGITEFLNLNETSLYPSPFDQSLIIETNTIKGYLKIEILDITGKLVRTLEDRMVSTGYYHRQYKMDEINDGIYFVKIINNNNIDVHRIVKTSE